MSRCRCCDVPLVGHVRYKSGEEFDGKFIEEDMCTRCIFEVEVADFIDTHSYQFQDLTENIYFLMNISEID